MNKRIIEMAIAAGFNPVNCTGGNVPLFEKFAELIVRECLLFTNPSPHEGTEFGQALAWADKNIREHFGVVE